MKLAYDIRSKYVHGAIPKKISQEKLQELFRSVANHARVACLIWFQLTRQHKRNEILRILEDAVIDEALTIRASALVQWHRLRQKTLVRL